MSVENKKKIQFSFDEKCFQASLRYCLLNLFIENKENTIKIVCFVRISNFFNILYSLITGPLYKDEGRPAPAVNYLSTSQDYNAS